MDDITSFSHRRLATILRNPNHPDHSAAKAEKDRRNMQREGLSSFKNFDEATYKDTGWQKPKKDNMSAADGMNKAKELARKGQSLAKVAASGRTVPTIKPVKEAGLRPSFAKKVRNDTLNKDKGPAPTGKTTGPDDYDFLKYKNKKKPVSEVSDEMKARYIRGADASHRAARSNEREAIIANKPEKAKKYKDIMKKRNAGMTKAFGEGVTETKGAPKGYHFTRDGKLKKGDAGADGDGGAKLRSDPLDKQRSKIPPIPEKYDGKESFGRANLLSRLKSKGMDVDKMHSNNMKDADAAKKRSAAAEKDLASFRKKSGINSESKIDEISMDTLSSYKDKAKYSRDKAQNSAAANYMRGTKGSGGRNDPDIKTMQKRDRGSELYYGNLANKLRKQFSAMKKKND